MTDLTRHKTHNEPRRQQHHLATPINNQQQQKEVPYTIWGTGGRASSSSSPPTPRPAQNAAFNNDTKKRGSTKHPYKSHERPTIRPATTATTARVCVHVHKCFNKPRDVCFHVAKPTYLRYTARACVRRQRPTVHIQDAGAHSCLQEIKSTKNHTPSVDTNVSSTPSARSTDFTDTPKYMHTYEPPSQTSTGHECKTRHPKNN